MKRILSFLCAAVLLLALMLPAVSMAAAKTMTVTVSVQTYQNLARTVLKSLNSYRKTNGLQELTMTADLEKIAIQRAAELFVLFDHARPDMTDFDTAVADCEHLSGAVVAEVLGCGESTAKGMFAAWKEDNSDLLLDEDFTEVGISCVYVKGSNNEYYWVIYFAQPAVEDAPKAADKTGTAAGAGRNIAVEVSSAMFAKADNSHKKFALKVNDVNMGSKSTASVSVYLYDKYDVKIGKIDNEDLTFKSSNTGVVTVADTGALSRKKTGTATLTVKFSGLDDATCTVTCGTGSSSSSGSTTGKTSTTALTAAEIKKLTPEVTARTLTKSATLTASLKGAEGFVLYRATAKGGDYTKVDEAETDGKASFKIDTAGFERASYYFKVRAYITSGGKRVYSDYSEAVRLTRP